MKKIIFLTLVINTQFYSTIATPKQIVILRHGEKETHNLVEEQYNVLSKKGIERAKKLANYFFKKPKFLKGKINYLFACTPRTLQTISYTSRKLKIPVSTFFALTKKDIHRATREVTQELKKKIYDDKTVVITWSHKAIPVLANMLGAKNIPDYWPDNSFNKFWILNFEKNKFIKFEEIEQKILPED